MNLIANLIEADDLGLETHSRRSMLQNLTSRPSALARLTGLKGAAKPVLLEKRPG